MRAQQLAVGWLVQVQAQPLVSFRQVQVAGQAAAGPPRGQGLLPLRGRGLRAGEAGRIGDPAGRGQNGAPVPDARQVRQAAGRAPAEPGDHGRLRPADLGEEPGQRRGMRAQFQGVQYQRLDKLPARKRHQEQPLRVACHGEVVHGDHGGVRGVVLAQADGRGQHRGHAGHVRHAGVQRRERQLRQDGPGAAGGQAGDGTEHLLAGLRVEQAGEPAGHRPCAARHADQGQVELAAPERRQGR